MKIKEILLVIFVLFGTFVSCEKEDNYQSMGIIIGSDVRDCICCGGYLIEIEDSTYNFDVLPASSDIDLIETSFPVNVKLDWTYDRECGDIQYIEITKIVKQ
jgi:hypothetical protein